MNSAEMKNKHKVLENSNQDIMIVVKKEELKRVECSHKI